MKTALTPIQPKPVEGSTIAVTTPVTSITSAMPQPRPSPTIIIQNADGTQMELRTTGALTPGGPADALTTQLTSILNTQEGTTNKTYDNNNMSFCLSGYANHLRTVSQRQSSENILLQVIPKTVINMYYNNDFRTQIYSVGLA